MTEPFVFLGVIMLALTAAAKVVDLWAKRLRRVAVRSEVRALLGRGGK